MPSVAIAESAKFQSPILRDWCIASVVCSYSVAVSLRKYLATLNAIELSVRAAPELNLDSRGRSRLKCQVVMLSRWRAVELVCQLLSKANGGL